MATTAITIFAKTIILVLLVLLWLWGHKPIKLKGSVHRQRKGQARRAIEKATHKRAGQPRLPRYKTRQKFPACPPLHADQLILRSDYLLQDAIHRLPTRRENW